MTELGSKPWKPYPRQLEALKIADEGVPVSEIARRMGIKPPAVGAILSMAYERLGITPENTPGHRLSHVRRMEAVKICKARGWWDA